MSLIIHAPNIHSGGGRALLLSLLSSLNESAVIQLDERFEPLPELSPDVRVIRVPPRVSARLMAERRLRSLCSGSDTLLCFGNLPPLFPNSARVFVYLQNFYLASSCSLSGLPWIARLRIRVERLWLRYFLRDATLLVQTETMMREVLEHLGRSAKLMPFFPEMMEPLNDHLNVRYDYLYVASGEAHKNHRRLLDAWVYISRYGYRPSLCLTLDTQRDMELCSLVERLRRQHGLHITNSPLPPEQISRLYAESSALIFPSLFESFGLPLLEARCAGMPILAAERDYVRNVVTPIVSFDPESVVSIARAVMRHQGREPEPVMPTDAVVFLKQLAELV